MTAKDARRSKKLTNKEYKKDFKGSRQTQARYRTKCFLDYDNKGGQNYNKPSQQQRPSFYNNSNRKNPNRKPYHSTGKKYHN